MVYVAGHDNAGHAGHADLSRDVHIWPDTCLCFHIHTYIHTCIPAYVHTCIHAYMHTCIRAYIHTHTYITTFNYTMHTYVAVSLVYMLTYVCINFRSQGAYRVDWDLLSQC